MLPVLLAAVWAYTLWRKDMGRHHAPHWSARTEMLLGTLIGGTVASNALTFTTSGGTLNGPTLTGTVTLPANTYAYVTGNTTLSTASVTFGNAAYLLGIPDPPSNGVSMFGRG